MIITYSLSFKKGRIKVGKFITKYKYFFIQYKNQTKYILIQLKS